MGAWIEILNMVINSNRRDSVAPLVGAWIEILGFDFKNQRNIVAPLVGAWIEIRYCYYNNIIHFESLLSWERGLKYLKS